MPRSRLLIAPLVSGLACLAVTPLALRDPAAPPGPPDRAAAVAVLHEWDRARAAAWREGDLAALARLYRPDSAAGRADREALRAYARRGLRVRGMQMQLADARVEAESPDRLELLVTDRLVGAVAVGPDTRVPLPRDRWSVRRVVLVRSGTHWRVAEVSAQAR